MTEDFQAYQALVGALKRSGIDFVSLRPGESIPSSIRVVITTPEDDVDFDSIVLADPAAPGEAIEEALHRLNGNGHSKVTIGVDPGKRPGIAVLEGDRVVAVYHVGVAEVPRVIADVVKSVSPGRVTVRVGHGARLVRSQVVNSLLDEGMRVELVDEDGTTPFLGRGVRGKSVSDIVAAVNIANTPGEPAGRQRVEPSRGEIRVIQEQSRERSHGQTTIPRRLARRVARGDLTLDEAIERHTSG